MVNARSEYCRFLWPFPGSERREDKKISEETEEKERYCFKLMSVNFKELSWQQCDTELFCKIYMLCNF